ncbi:hypothetical protein [Litchfieldella rifensis]|uniref:Uncharacterized protein n=1 Tax=Litchfieldella rifensis TaxID=762643 RepID=A0ABV7LIV8_9GAMM
MTHRFTRQAWPLIPFLALLTGCSSSLGPMSWETGYRATGVAQAGNEASLRQSISPIACRTQPGETGIVTLPPGCANDLNLQFMVERPRDLLHGREMGPARAGPVANAAQERLANRERANARRQKLEGEASSSTNYATTSDM